MVSFNPSRPSVSAPELSCTRRVPVTAFRADPNAGIELYYLPAGWLAFQSGGETVRVTAGQLAVFWAATPHQVIGHGDLLEHYFTASVPLAWFLANDFPARLVQALLQGRLVCGQPGEAHALDERMFSTWEQVPGDSDPEIALAMLLELKARLLRLALAEAPSAIANMPAGDRSIQADAIADLIARRCTSRLTVGTIAREVKLAPKHVGSLFTRFYGTSVAEFITRHRVFHAQRLLVTSRAKVAAVATASGFGSLSRFNSVFRRVCGCSPRSFRRRNTPPPSAPASES